MEFSTVSETWETVAKLRNTRIGHGASVVSVDDYRNYVIDCKPTTTTFVASMTIVNASSVYNDDYEKWGPEQALTGVSPNQFNYWHSSEDDDNPSITFKMQQEHEVLAVEVVDRQDCCNERYQSVEVRIGSSPSFDDAQSCGIQSFEGETRYR